MLHEQDIVSNASTNPTKFYNIAKRKTSYKQTISYLQMGVCDDNGKSIIKTSDHEKAQFVCNFICVLTA